MLQELKDIAKEKKVKVLLLKEPDRIKQRERAFPYIETYSDFILSFIKEDKNQIIEFILEKNNDFQSLREGGIKLERNNPW